jgi:hypothetical protein
MTTPDSPGLLTLLGHELRAPAGVIGGYLTMLERHPLTPDQERALDGARRAQQTLVEILDDVRRLVDVWRDEGPAARRLPLTDVLERTVGRCTKPTSTSTCRSTPTLTSASPSIATCRAVAGRHRHHCGASMARR